MTSPTRGRDTAVYQRVAVLAHVLFLVIFLLTFALVGEVTPSVVALGIGAAVFAVWTVYLLRVEAQARHDDAMAASANRRNQIDRTFASERSPMGPPSVVPSATGSTVVAAAPTGPASNPIVRPGAHTEPMGG